MPGCEVLGEYRHCRVASPKKFDPRSFRVKAISKDVKIVVACPKGQYSPSTRKCKVGMQRQKVMTRVKRGR